MALATVTVKFINQPKEGKKEGSIKLQAIRSTESRLRCCPYSNRAAPTKWSTRPANGRARRSGRSSRPSLLALLPLHRAAVAAMTRIRR